MLCESTNSSSVPLFTRVQKFILKSNSTEEIHRDLRITVDFSKAHSKVSKNVLNIQISDDEDPFFYFSLTLTEEDYQHLKQLQGLLVDFQSFPSQVIRLLEQCSESDQNNSRFLLLLECEKKNGIGDLSSNSLKIVETNNFKHLNHLILQLEPGNDNDIKRLMLQKIKTLKDQNDKAQKVISDLESQVYSKNKLLASREEELLQTQQKWKEDTLTFKAESSKELCEETEKLRKAQLDWQIKIQRERNDLEDKFQNNLKEKDSELSRLRLENQILQEKRSLADLTISDQARRIESLEKEASTSRGEIGTLRKQNSKLDNDYHEKEKSVNSLKTRLAVAEQEAKDMSILLKRQQEFLNTANEQKLRLEEALNDKERNVQRKQGTIQNLTDDLVKANSIITKIQKDLTVVSQKLKVRTVIALEQEKVVENSQLKIKELEETLLNKEKKIKNLVESENKLKSSLSELEISSESKEKKIKDNERLIDWLNRRLSDQTKTSTNGLGSVPGMTSTPFPRLRSNEMASNVNLPYSTISASVQVESLDQVKNIHLEDQQQDPRVNPSQVPNTKPRVALSENPLTSRTSDPSSKKTSLSAKSGGKTATQKMSGFKRNTLSEVQATSVPSSYFLK